MRIVLTIALGLLTAELICILMAAMTIDPDHLCAGADCELPLRNDGPNGRPDRARGGTNPFIGDPDRVRDPAHNMNAAESPAVLSMQLRDVRRLDAHRATISLDLHCDRGAPLNTLRIECDLPAGVSGVEAVEFIGPPATWSVEAGKLVLLLDEPRTIWVGDGGWSTDITVRLSAPPPGAMPLALEIRLSGAGPGTLQTRDSSLPLIVPATAGSAQSAPAANENAPHD